MSLHFPAPDELKAAERRAISLHGQQRLDTVTALEATAAEAIRAYAACFRVSPHLALVRLAAKMAREKACDRNGSLNDRMADVIEATAALIDSDPEDIDTHEDYAACAAHDFAQWFRDTP